MLVCLEYNIRKLFRFYSCKAKFDYWKTTLGLEHESFNKPSVKKD